jgi:UDP-N-acetylglucosamine/UDP-N-acetylgalactosamine diphosphorylase
MTKAPAALVERLASYGQEHLLAGWDHLDAGARQRLTDQVAALDLAELMRLAGQKEDASATRRRAEQARSPRAIRLEGQPPQTPSRAEAIARGEQMLDQGRVGVILVAGGQGTRLEFPYPKGMYPIGPVSGKSLYQIHAEKVWALGRRHAKALPYYVMTSDATHAETVAFFAERDHFGLDPADVFFFQQGSMPAVDAESHRLLLAAPDELFLSPDGHGGVLEALARSGALEDMRRRGVEWLFYHQVDNPLAPVADAVFLGHHALAGAEASVKVVAKRFPTEKVGNVVEVDGRVQIIEYFQLDDDLASATEADGSPRFWAGSTAIHVFNREFLERLTAGGVDLPLHPSLKKVPHVDASGRTVEPEGPNAIKFERFIFDAFPLARRTLVLEVRRDDEYDPLKNAEGDHSPEAVKASLSSLYARWLRQCGVAVPECDLSPIEISPRYALDGTQLAEKVDRSVRVDGPLYLEEPSTRCCTPS